MATLVLISGPIAAGKTTLGRNIAANLLLPFINKDTYKELLFDELGSKDRAWSQKIGSASWKIIYATVHSILAGNQSCIFEANFNSKFDSAKIQTMINTYNCQVIEVHCAAEGTVLLERFKKRSESGERHPGHMDHENYEEFKTDLLQGACAPLNVPSTIINVNTTDFDTVDYTKIMQTLRNYVR